jgi:hypothetical protein
MIEIHSGLIIFRTFIEESPEQVIAVTDFINSDTGFFLETVEGMTRKKDNNTYYSKSVRTGKLLKVV